MVAHFLTGVNMRFAELKESSSTLIKQIQQILSQLGFDLGPAGVDGKLGPYTQRAMDAYKTGKLPPKKDTNGSDTTHQSSGSELIPAKGRVSGHYGRIVTGPKGNKIPHPGVDIAAPTGAPVVAPFDGKIVFAGSAGSAGNLVELITTDGVKHRFMHLSKILVGKGDAVKKGQSVGLVGSTGFSTGPHLHWEKYASGGKQVNPLA